MHNLGVLPNIEPEKRIATPHIGIFKGLVGYIQSTILWYVNTDYIIQVYMCVHVCEPVCSCVIFKHPCIYTYQFCHI